MKRIITRYARRARGPLVLLLVVALGACDDGFGPQPWSDRPDTIDIYSLARPEHIGLPGAYNFAWAPVPGAVVVELQRNNPGAVFDVAFSEDEGGFVALPAGMFQTFLSQAGLQPQPAETFETLTQVPREGYITDALVPLTSGGVYAVRTRSRETGCTRYGKFEVLDLDGAEGIVRIRAVASPICNDRSLVPPDVD